MKIDTLLRRAKKLDTIMKPAVTILSYQDGWYHLKRGTWDGKHESRTKETLHRTRPQAMREYSDFLARFSESQQRAAVLIDLSDLQQGG